MRVRQIQLPELLAIVVVAVATSAVAGPFDAWRYQHAVPVADQGFIEIDVPPEALDAARPDAGDLRIADADGEEVPYLRVTSEPGRVVAAPKFRATLGPGVTRVDIETPGDRSVEAVMLASPARRFLKAVRVEASDDGATWSPLLAGAPIFREANGAEQLRVAFGPSAAKFLRLTIDDSRSKAIPVSGARLRLVPDLPLETEAVTATIVERLESAGQTRLEVDFGNAHLPLASLGIESTDRLFMRRIELITPSLEGAEIREKRLGGGTIFRVAVEGVATKSQLAVPIAVNTPAQRLTLAIENGDSPPLQITGVRASRRLVRLRFLASRAGDFTLFAGNPDAGAPDYDVKALARGLAGAEVIPCGVGPRVENSSFSAAAQLPQIPVFGAALDTAAWAYRKPIALAAAGIQQLELDAQVLSRTGVRGADWRLIRDGHQVPFIVERTSIARAVAPAVAEVPDPKRPKVSRWEIQVPYEGLPGSTLVCRTDAPLFDRPVSLVEETRDSYGQRRTRSLGKTRWVRKAEAPGSELRVSIVARPATARWILEIDNGDNLPIALRDFAVYHPAVRLLFKTSDAGGLDFYYGNRESTPPDYDLGLATAELIRARRFTATLGEEEVLKAAGEGPLRIGGKPGVVFWVVLIAVVAGLLFFIAKLLPKTADGQ